jgi:methyltransferase (TIGR00027 family)
MWPGARTSGIARTRLIDDWLRQALGQGSRQLVILGAGFDFRAWRLPELAAAPVYEVDHPATAAEKRRLILQYGLDPSRIAQAAIDLDQESVAEGLERHGFDPHRRTIVLWEGVSQYLSEAAVDAVLAWAASLAPGSLLAFTYVHENLLRNPASFENAAPILQAAAKAGEPWCFGIDPALLATWLRKSGLELLQDLGADEYRARYAAQGISAWRGYAFYRAALARVAANA